MFSQPSFGGKMPEMPSMVNPCQQSPFSSVKDPFSNTAVKPNMNGPPEEMFKSPFGDSMNPFASDSSPFSNVFQKPQAPPLRNPNHPALQKKEFVPSGQPPCPPPPCADVPVEKEKCEEEPICERPAPRQRSHSHYPPPPSSFTRRNAFVPEGQRRMPVNYHRC
ncbi:hypothetical protein BLNAU_24021 [Blattamonas nauphoetae]|uniref:Uncharacterized protein n=1 Tax=Blattamonas nauphoetae TaxID=2049346 RepID=A0ABQ9WNK9_9EUKA|nr:hypothetical protein BLNAU_24021 [Blattamonas nauphoetae]